MHSDTSKDDQDVDPKDVVIDCQGSIDLPSIGSANNA